MIEGHQLTFEAEKEDAPKQMKVKRYLRLRKNCSLPAMKFKTLRKTEPSDCSEEDKKWYEDFWIDYANDSGNEICKQNMNLTYLCKRKKDMRSMENCLEG